MNAIEEITEIMKASLNISDKQPRSQQDRGEELKGNIKPIYSYNKCQHIYPYTNNHDVQNKELDHNNKLEK